jgi:hypothetical protein
LKKGGKTGKKKHEENGKKGDKGYEKGATVNDPVLSSGHLPPRWPYSFEDGPAMMVYYMGMSYQT